jgi:hypothetical protein
MGQVGALLGFGVLVVTDPELLSAHEPSPYQRSQGIVSSMGGLIHGLPR